MATAEELAVPLEERVVMWSQIPEIQRGMEQPAPEVTFDALLPHFARNPDSIIQGTVTGDPITSAQVMWPGNVPGLFTVLSRHSSGAVTSYKITYGSPLERTYTQPGIVRNAAGTPTSIPAIVITFEAPVFGSLISGGTPSGSTPTTILSGGTPSGATPSLTISGGKP